MPAPEDIEAYVALMGALLDPAAAAAGRGAAAPLMAELQPAPLPSPKSRHLSSSRCPKRRKRRRTTEGGERCCGSPPNA
jgi:two-component system sensor histidine kinase and response regulator WspE